MNPVRLLIVLVAAVSAIGLAVVMQRAFYGKPAAPVAAAAPVAGKPMTQVLVAKHDLAIGARLTGDDVTWQPWPTDSRQRRLHHQRRRPAQGGGRQGRRRDGRPPPPPT
jgi:pilus assembly protein CpaB